MFNRIVWFPNSLNIYLEEIQFHWQYWSWFQHKVLVFKSMLLDALRVFRSLSILPKGHWAIITVKQKQQQQQQHIKRFDKTVGKMTWKLVYVSVRVAPSSQPKNTVKTQRAQQAPRTVHNPIVCLQNRCLYIIIYIKYTYMNLYSIILPATKLSAIQKNTKKKTRVK